MNDVPRDLSGTFQEVLKRAEEAVGKNAVVYYRVEVCIETPAGAQGTATWENSRYGTSPMGNIRRRPQKGQGR